MIAVFKNNIYRMFERKTLLLVMLLLLGGSIVAAIFISSQQSVIANIAYVGDHPASSINQDQLAITYVTEAPPMSDLVAAKFDAVVVPGADGFEILTIKNEAVRAEIMAALHGAQVDVAADSVGVKIIGFMMMFILMQGSLLSMLFAEDRERKQLKRIVASSTSVWQYLLAQASFIFICLFVPALLLLYVIKYISGADIGFDFGQYVGLIALVSGLATAISLCIHAVIKKADSANMIASAVIVMSSVLAGSFYSFEQGNPVLETIIQFIPQKAIMNVANELAAGMQFSIHLLYVILWVSVLLVIAVFITRKNYVFSD